MLRITKPLCQHHIQTAIIGAGVIGLAVSRALSKKGHEVLLLEQATSIGSETSSRNSEVIHAGIYYDRNIMPYKSKFCVEGKQLLYQYCIERDVPFKQCGKLLVATDADQRDSGLPKLVEYAKGNGVHDLKIVSMEDIKDPYSDVYEPNVKCTGAVYSPSTGIIDSHSFMQSMLAEAEEHGTTLALNCRVEGGRSAGPNVILTVDGEEMVCDNVIVCAGLHSHKIASDILSQSNQQSSVSKQNEARKIPRQFYAKGNYFTLQNQQQPFSRLVYPLPDPRGGLGVHATIDLSGSTKFGPDVEWIDDAVINPYDIDMNVDPNRAKSFYAAIRKYWPDLNDDNLVADYSGIRPKLWHPSQTNIDNALKDFFIATPNHHGVQGLHVLLGIESPGLTSSLAIGNHMAKIID
ncbi:L-2-hydroxyglutarate dehydrogenase [Skeletonema marinoi]|uniref:L-2-hydroxyglutarate dehydrogenase, mitochondrial n=1 Tax=Skeletonema marinoi TaxID=267567 RepID=A0AAD8XX37_9STRA|nr:L-2-hydroxyglutarate dehydrogenase [Skeletonema marinoi]